MLSTEPSIPMSSHTRRVLTPGASRKRKERESIDAIKASTTISTTTPTTKAEPASANRLLAGYLAHEYLTKGTLLGQKWDPTRAESANESAAKTRKTNQNGRVEAVPAARSAPAKHQSYAELANLLKREGTHIPGIVNPAQLASWLQI